ncbi:MAG: hypothetical protein ACRD0P_14885 [Stackebrandtia sp.]
MAVFTTLAAAETAAAASPQDDPIPESLTAQPAAAATFSGPVNAITYADGKFFAGGEFDNAAAGGESYQRTSLAAVGTDGGLGKFSPELDGPVSALTHDADYLYAAGMFTEANGYEARHLVRFDLETGAVDQGFDVSVNALPRALEIADDRLYLGGDFNSVNGESRSKIAAVSLSDGALVDEFTPSFDRGVRALEAANGNLYVGGGFTEVDGQASRKLTALNRETGERDTGFAPEDLGLVYDIDVTDERVYTAVGGRGGRVATYDTGGDLEWQRITDGDVTALTIGGDTVVAGGHFDRLCDGTDLGDNGKCLDGVFADRGKLFAVDSGNEVSGWNPDGNSVTGTHALAHGGGMVAAGGAFTTFNDGETQRHGFALFPY